MSNRIYLALPMYGPVYPAFYQRWLRFQGQAARAVSKVTPGKALPILTMNMAYIDHADTAIVNEALPNPDWDYLMLVEHDNIVPDDWADVVVNELDPDIHKIVGRWYFGKAQEDMRSICGYLRSSGDFDRFSYDQVQYFRQHPGLYRVGAGMEGVDDSAVTFSIGMGCTAIHRSVFENWEKDHHPDGRPKPTGAMPWFQSVSSWKPEEKKIGYTGHDVWFCSEAQRQGIDVWVDTRKAAGHIGEFISDEETYTLTAQHMMAGGQTTAGMLDGSQRPLPPGIPTAMSDEELKQLARLSVGKTVLEIGSRAGASTIGMARGAEIVFALDWHRGDQWHEGKGQGDTLDTFWRYVGAYNLRDKVVPLVGTSQQVLPTLRPQMFDLIFVDGDHSYEGVRHDIEHCLQLLRPGGTMVFHDYRRELEDGYEHRDLGVTRAVDEVFGVPTRLVGTLAIVEPTSERLLSIV